MSSATLEALSAIYALVLAPAEVLSTRAAEVTQFGSPVFELVDAMKRVMKDHHALGLSAPQVGASKRVILYTPHADTHPDDRDIRAIVNPRIVESSGPMEADWEGCLSHPDVRVQIVRPTIVDVVGDNLGGITFTKRFTGMTARIIQHEIDHLDGISILDRAGLQYADKSLEPLQGRAECTG